MSEVPVENREGAKFCEEFGAKFEIECSACISVIPLAKRIKA
jgi:hypothetical protein